MEDRKNYFDEDRFLKEHEKSIDSKGLTHGAAVLLESLLEHQADKMKWPSDDFRRQCTNRAFHRFFENARLWASYNPEKCRPYAYFSVITKQMLITARYQGKTPAQREAERMVDRDERFRKRFGKDRGK